MIQRVQSLFLLAATICSILIITIPFAELYDAHSKLFIMYFYGLKNVAGDYMVNRNLPLAGVTIVTGLLSFFTIIIYKRRVLQMRICVYNILLTLAQIGLLLFSFYRYKSYIDSTTSFSFTVILPLINIVLIFQAFRAIRRDDLLLKSYDRLR